MYKLCLSPSHASLRDMPPRDWSHRFLDSTRGRIIARLRRGPGTVEELALTTGLTPNGVRVHLTTLERDGWISAGSVRRTASPGKPATLYALAPGADAQLSRAYRPLLLALLAELGAREPAARRETLLRESGRRLAAGLTQEALGPARQRIARLLTALGAEVDVVERGRGRYEVRGFGCPVGDAVAVEPRVCRSVTALLEGALGARVVERCDRENGACCRFEVTMPRAS
jgi:predicted ArsR family transcriptional regulator